MHDEIDYELDNLKDVKRCPNCKMVTVKARRIQPVKVHPHDIQPYCGENVSL